MGEFTTVGLDVVAAKFLEREEETTKAVVKMLEVGGGNLSKGTAGRSCGNGDKGNGGFYTVYKSNQS